MTPDPLLGLLVGVQEKYVLIGLMYARISPIFLILPILNNGVLSSALIRNSIIFTIIIGLWPVIDTSIVTDAMSGTDLVVIVAKETIIGCALAFVMALPFWIFNAMGAFIDVARGSSMGSLVDPTNGQESTEMQNFINFCVCAMYMQMGGLKLMLETLAQSYQDIGFGQSYEIKFQTIVPFLTQIFEQGFILAAPVLLTLLLTECLLGLLARFTPQLSAFSVAMTIKSVIALSVLSLYFWQIAPDRLPQFVTEYSQWHFLQGVK